MGLTFNGKLFRYKLWRISKNILSSELFNPFELRDLTKISVIYQEPTEYEFELDIISEISIPDIPYEIKNQSIMLESHNTSSKNLKFDSSISNEKFIYLIPHINSEIKENINQNLKICQKWDSNPRPHQWTRILQRRKEVSS